MKAFRAWEQMNHAQNSKGKSTTPKPPKPPQESPYQSGREASNNMPRGSPPKTRPGWDQFREPEVNIPNLNRANTTRTPKRQGFAPGAVGGDEPAARNASAYFNVTRGGRPNVSGPPPPFDLPPRGSSPTMRKPDPVGRFRSQSGSDNLSMGAERISTPYATTGGERTYFSSSGLGRSASTREPQQETERNGTRGTTYRTPSSQTRSERHQSASPSMRNSSHRHRSPSLYSTSSASSTDSAHTEDGRRYYASRRKAEQSRVPRDGSRTRRSFDHPGGNESKGTGNLHPEAPPPPSNSRRNAWDQRDEAARQAATSKRFSSDSTTHSPYTPTAQQKPSPSTATASGSTGPPPDSQHPLRKSGSWQEKYHSKGAMGDSDTAGRADNPPMYDNPRLSPKSAHLPRRKSSAWPHPSQENSPKSPPVTPYWAVPSSVWPKKLSTIPEELGKPSQRTEPTKHPTKEKANRSSRNSFSIPKANEIHEKTSPLPRDMKSHSSDNINAKFSPTEWKGKFTGNATEYFAPVPRRPGSTAGSKGSPDRGRQANRTPLQEQHNQPSVSHQGNSDNNNTQAPTAKAAEASWSSGKTKFSADEWRETFKEQTWVFPPPPPRTSPTRHPNFKRPITPRSRNSNKRPTMQHPQRTNVDEPDEAGAGNNPADNAESSSSHTSADGSAMDIDTSSTPPVTVPPVSANPNGVDPNDVTPKKSQHVPPSSIPPSSNGTRSDPQDASDLNLGGLKNVAPFAPTKEGLKDLDDLSQTLPFESRPAPRRQSLAPQRLALPNPPKGPEVPEKLTQNGWERYLAQMRAYMYEWNGYNKKMLSHFSDRQREVEDGLAPEWMSAVGEGGSGGKGGYGKLMKGIEEDFRVRAHWDVSWEKHRECLLGLGRIRERLTKATPAV